MLQRFSYGLLGAILSSGAPLGLLALRLRQRQASVSVHEAKAAVSTDPAAYAYVATATAVAFTAFGYLLGRQADRLLDLSLKDALTGLHNRPGVLAPAAR